MTVSVAPSVAAPVTDRLPPTATFPVTEAEPMVEEPTTQEVPPTLRLLAVRAPRGRDRAAHGNSASDTSSTRDHERAIGGPGRGGCGKTVDLASRGTWSRPRRCRQES